MKVHAINNEDSESRNSPLALAEATDFVIKRARELVMQLIQHTGREQPPFLPKELAPLQGVKDIVKADLGDLNAVLLRCADGYIIRVNANHPEVRQNFSCAHEIGHTFLDELGQHNVAIKTDFRGDTKASKTKERLCDIAAAELLMPEPIFSKYLKGLGLSLNCIEYLARIFRVSIPAAAIRVAEVSEERCLAILWQKRKPKGLRLAWLVGPGKQRGEGRFILSGSTWVTKNSGLFKAYESDSIVKSHKMLKLGVAKKRCYMESKGFGFGENRYVLSLVFLDR